MPIAEIEEIFNKYKQNEVKIEHLLSVKQKDDDPVVETEPQKKTSIKIEDVRARNKQILLELENAKANLRSKAIFSPSEMQWQRIYQNYNQVRSMPVTTYKCHNAIYV